MTTDDISMISDAGLISVIFISKTAIRKQMIMPNVATNCILFQLVNIFFIVSPYFS